MESLKKVIEEGMVVDIKFKGVLYKNCELVFFVPFVKCDGDEGDKLCLHYRSRSAGIKQLCRYCECPNHETDNPLARFSYRTEPQLKSLLDNNRWVQLQQLSQVGVPNAFHGVRFGLHNERGIHGACPSEMLHAIQLGIFIYTRDCFFHQVGKSSKAADKINALSCKIGVLLARQSDRDKPRTKFSKGIYRGKLMAKEYSGVLLVMVALLRSEKGRRLLLHAWKKGFRKEGKLEDWVMLVETLLVWEAYLNQPQMPREEVKRLKRKNCYLLYLLKTVCNRQRAWGSE